MRLKDKFLAQITVLENLNFDLQKSWKNAYENVGALMQLVIVFVGE